MNRIALALTIAAVSTGAAAQSSRKQPTWDDLLKPVEVKTNPAIPIAPPQVIVPAKPPVTPAALLDGCVISAIGRLPKADGLRVTSSSINYRDTHDLMGKPLDNWIVSVSVDLHGRQTSYQWLCQIYAKAEATLRNM